MTLDEIAQKVVDDLEWSSSIPNIKAMVLTAMTNVVAAEREACAAIVDDVAQELRRQRDPGMANHCAMLARRIRQRGDSSAADYLAQCDSD